MRIPLGWLHLIEKKHGCILNRVILKNFLGVSLSNPCSPKLLEVIKHESIERTLKALKPHGLYDVEQLDY